jgi:hypothetical protein
MNTENTETIPLVKTNYYPIQCTDCKKKDTIMYNYIGRANSPNVVYLSSSSATGNLPLGYLTSELVVCPTPESMIKTFPFLEFPATSGNVNGAIVIIHKPLTNGLPLYSCFLLQRSDISNPDTAVLETLFVPNDYTKKSYQSVPFELAMRDFVSESIVYENLTDRHHNPCIVVFFQDQLLVHFPNSSGDRRSPSELVVQRLSAPLPKEDSTKKISLLEGMTDDMTDETTGEMMISTRNDPNYSYQECTMVPVDGIDVNGGDVQYTFQVSQDSNLVSGNMEVNYVNNVSGVIIYFLAAMLIYFGTPFGYRTVMCSILKKFEGGLGGTATFVDYLRNTQNLFGMGEFKGFAILFNLAYILVIVGLFMGAFTPGANIWSIYSTAIFMILAWAIGLVAILNNPLPPEC